MPRHDYSTGYLGTSSRLLEAGQYYSKAGSSHVSSSAGRAIAFLGSVLNRGKSRNISLPKNYMKRKYTSHNPTFLEKAAKVFKGKGGRKVALAKFKARKSVPAHSRIGRLNARFNRGVSGKAALAHYEAKGIYKPAKTVKGKSHVKGPLKKKVKVSKSLRKKILQVGASKMIRGRYTMFHTGGQLGVSVDNQLNYIVDAGVVQDASGTTLWPYLFTPDQFIDAASILFNGKKEHHDSTQYEPNATDAVTGLPANFPFNTIKFCVVNSYSKYTLKNASNRPQLVTCYILAPKNYGEVSYVSPFTSGAADIPLSISGNLTGTDAGLVIPADTDLFNSVTQDTTDGNLRITGFTNVLGQLPMGLEPMSFPTFRNRWKAETVKMLLEPGQSDTIFVQGPKGFDFDGKKNVGPVFYRNFQKYSRQCLFTVQNDLVETNSNPRRTGFFISNSVTGSITPKAVCVCREDAYVIEMPQQTGALFTVAQAAAVAAGHSAVVPDNLRKGIHVHLCSFEPTNGVVEETNEMDPSTVIDP